MIRPLFNLLNGINKKLYKKQDKIVIYSNRGFRDNVRVLYDYLIENNFNNDYRIICSVNDYKDYRNTKISNVTFTNNYFGIIHFLTSKYFFYSFGKYPIKPSKNQQVINLWHGTPLKKIGNLEKEKKYIDYNYFNFILATSDIFAEVMKDAFSCEDDQVMICGHPRNDLLFKPLENTFDDREKLVLWLPTHRNYDEVDGVSSKDEGSIPIFTNHNKMNRLDEYLNRLKIRLIIKVHPTQSFEGLEYKKYRNIDIWNEKDLNENGFELYRLLASADALITDYSSVYFDFLLLNRPIAFTINDMEMYTGERGFVFDNPEDYMPGKKVASESDFYDFLGDLSKDNDDYKMEREKINKIANYYTDGNNCERVLDAVGIKRNTRSA